MVWKTNLMRCFKVSAYVENWARSKSSCAKELGTSGDTTLEVKRLKTLERRVTETLS